ncbi:hypothetical protein Mycch_3051 [Mycolicibacterium chubuense NBB4]|uniref:Uncharacterized protein n=1 Tax=Mycolicibacterium chubuense (strain NBB4) TaxID=710421 RepID=I4BKJ6_MYCCN|nr:hypothetical protein Mycch_3051 [Mycolicibacterium chubuense NBB4]
MFSLIVFAGIVFALVAAVGLPYRQTWYGRWSR